MRLVGLSNTLWHGGIEQSDGQRRSTMGVSKETLRQMIRDMGGPELSDERLEQVMAQVELHQAQSEKLRELDLATVFPARLMKTDPDSDSEAS